MMTFREFNDSVVATKTAEEVAVYLDQLPSKSYIIQILRDFRDIVSKLEYANQAAMDHSEGVSINDIKRITGKVGQFISDDISIRSFTTKRSSVNIDIVQRGLADVQANLIARLDVKSLKSIYHTLYGDVDRFYMLSRYLELLSTTKRNDELSFDAGFEAVVTAFAKVSDVMDPVVYNLIDIKSRSICDDLSVLIKATYSTNIEIQKASVLINNIIRDVTPLLTIYQKIQATI